MTETPRGIPDRVPNGKRFVGHNRHSITQKHRDGRWVWTCNTCPWPVTEYPEREGGR